MALLKILFPILFIVYSLGEVARINIFSSVNSGFFDIILLCILFIWIIFSKKSKYELLKPLILFSSAAILSLLINITRFTSTELFISSLYLVRFILYAGIYFVLIDVDKKLISRIPFYMFISGLLFMIFGFIQYFFYPTLKNLYYLGWDDHMYRLYSTFLDPNFAGVFLVLFLVFVFIMRDKILPEKYIWIIYIAMIMNIAAIVITFSRGALLMLLVCVLTYSFITKNWKIAAGLITTFVIIFIILSPKFYLENINLFRFASTEARLETSKNAITYFKKNPMGVGFNTYRFARKEYELTDWAGYGPSHAGSGVDNSFILVLVTGGVLGFAAYVYLIYRIFKLGYSRINKNKAGLVLVVSLAGLVVNSMFINSLFYSFLMVWMFTLAGLTENNSRE